MVWRLTRTHLLQAAAMASPAALVVLLAAFLVTAAVAEHPLWRTAAVNMSEAAVLRDRPSIVRLAQHGEDPRLPHVVRAGLLTNTSVLLTPFEGAIAARRPEVLDLLLSLADLDAPAWSRLACLSKSADEPALEDLLNQHRPAGVVPDCGAIVRPW